MPTRYQNTKMLSVSELAAREALVYIVRQAHDFQGWLSGLGV